MDFLENFVNFVKIKAEDISSAFLSTLLFSLKAFYENCLLSMEPVFSFAEYLR